ncbi:MAG: hypothetical protein WDO24_14105 [Pseudomonadota bacterium]
MMVPGGRDRRYSDETAHAIDQAVQHIVEQALARTLALLERQRPTLERGAALLLEQETLDEGQLKALADGQRTDDREQRTVRATIRRLTSVLRRARAMPPDRAWSGPGRRADTCRRRPRAGPSGSGPISDRLRSSSGAQLTHHEHRAGRTPGPGR